MRANQLSDAFTTPPIAGTDLLQPEHTSLGHPRHNHELGLSTCRKKAGVSPKGVLSYLAGLRFLSTPADAYERSLEEGILSDMSKVSSTSTVQLHGSQNGSITTSFQLPSFGGQSPTFNY